MSDNIEFDSREIAVLFHVLNNAYGGAFADARQRAKECDDIHSDEFIRIYSRLINKLANA